MYWSWKQFLLLVYFELKCSLFGFFKMLRMKIRITGFQLWTARTEINKKKKEKIFFIFFLKSNTILREERRGNYVAENLSQHFSLPIKGFFLALIKKASFQNTWKNKICLVIFSFMNRLYKISTTRFMQIWNSYVTQVPYVDQSWCQYFISKCI